MIEFFFSNNAGELHVISLKSKTKYRGRCYNSIPPLPTKKKVHKTGFTNSKDKVKEFLGYCGLSCRNDCIIGLNK
jgi:hypothetical protein